MRPDTPFKDDLLNGAQEIADYLGWPARRVYYQIEKGGLPVKRLGAAHSSPVDRRSSAYCPRCRSVDGHRLNDSTGKDAPGLGRTQARPTLVMLRGMTSSKIGAR